MKTVIVTGSCGLVGSESVSFFSKKGFRVIGIDNNSRKIFFGKDGDISWIKNKLLKEIKNCCESYRAKYKSIWQS